MPTVAKTVCRSPASDKKSTRIATWKFDALRRIILKTLPTRGEGVPTTDLYGIIAKALTPQQRKDLGVIPWYTTMVKLELEVRKEIVRVKDVVPQRLLKVSARSR